MTSAYIATSLRTAVGKAPRGSLKHVRPDELGAAAIKEAIARLPNLPPRDVEDIIFGTAFPEAEQGLNLGRIVAHRAGLPDSVPGCTVSRCCASG
ncbi:MAG: acetyl-CoA C-acyltransferase, partial [Cyanobacteria bacterium P01_E01_bin.48]